MSMPAGVAQWVADEWSAPKTQVAFGALAAPGVTPPVSLTGGAAVLIWGEWPVLTLTISRSTDGGVTWTDTMVFPSDASYSQENLAAYRGLMTTLPNGTALYRLRLDAPFRGNVVNWAIYQ